jgi:hypothetical protein
MVADLRRLTKALLFAAEAHRNQRRKGAARQKSSLPQSPKSVSEMLTLDTSQSGVSIATSLCRKTSVDARKDSVRTDADKRTGKSMPLPKVASDTGQGD